MRYFLLLICALALQPLHAQLVATPMTAGRTADGVTYFLPKTAFRIHLLVEKTTYRPGPFARYASRYLHRSGISQEEETDYKVVRCEVTQLGVRDTSKCFSMKLKGGKSDMADFRFSDDGVLLAVNDEPIAMKEHPAFKPAPRPQAIDPYQFLGADVHAASSTAKMAELTVAQMEDLQEHRQQLITGEADDMPQDDRQLQRMLSEIDRQQQALMSLFIGTVQRDTVEHQLTICPDKEVQREVLFRLSRQLGLVDKDDLSGIPYYISIEDPYKTDEEKYPLAENKKNEGLYVNVPGRIVLSVYREEHLLAAFEVSAAQFGFVELRDGQIFKRYVTHMQLHPATGAIVKTLVDSEK